MRNALEIFCDVSREKVRPYVPDELRFEVFRSLHNLSHPGIRATKRLIQDRFVWPSMLKEIAKWTRCCFPCQRSKVQRHTHVHIDLVGLFPPSDGFVFLLTCIDRYTRWPEVTPVSDISAEAVAKSFIANWISRFGVPAIITTDQGGQFQSRLLYSLKQMLGIQRIRTTPYHPSSNGMVERLHRIFKHFTIKINDRTYTISIDRLKPAFLLNDTDSTKKPFPVQKSSHPVELSPRLDQNVPIPATTRSGRRVRFNPKYL
ncbi:hypothetical protein TNCV_733651 [Trichonephila clavipes]|nr:hypothetical protein TNCV_733651 [Trichonephila clavipes]